MFTQRLQDWVRATARRFVTAIHLIGVTPNTLTVTGLVVTACGAVLVGLGYLVAGGVVIVVAALFDILDGAVARVTGKVYRYGAFLDSTTDRYAEAFTFMALLYYYLYHSPTPTHSVEPLLILAALTGSLLVSYVRARAQSLGFACDGGLLARPERVVILVAGLLFPGALLVPCLWILALLTNVTAIQRIWFVWRESRRTLAVEA